MIARECIRSGERDSVEPVVIDKDRKMGSLCRHTVPPYPTRSRETTRSPSMRNPIVNFVGKIPPEPTLVWRLFSLRQDRGYRTVLTAGMVPYPKKKQDDPPARAYGMKMRNPSFIPSILHGRDWAGIAWIDFHSKKILKKYLEPLFGRTADRADFRRTFAGAQVPADTAAPHRIGKAGGNGGFLCRHLP